MKDKRLSWRHAAAAGLLLTGAPLAIGAPPEAPPNQCGPMAGGPDGHGGPPPWAHAGPGGAPGRGAEWSLPPPYLADLTLTEDQQDRVFTILHGAAPALRDQEKAGHKARESLRELSLSPQYDETRAKALTDSIARAEAQTALLRAHADRDIYALLTTEQRAQVVEHHRAEVARRR